MKKSYEVNVCILWNNECTLQEDSPFHVPRANSYNPYNFTRSYFLLASTVSNRRRLNTVKFVKVSRVLAFVSVFAFGLLPFAFASLRACVSVSVC